MIYFVSAELDYEGIIDRTISVRGCQGECVRPGDLDELRMIPFADGRYAAWAYICLGDDDSATKTTDDDAVSAFSALVKSRVAPYTVQCTISGSDRDFYSVSKLSNVVLLRMKINEYGDVEGIVLAVNEHDAIMQAKAYLAKQIRNLYNNNEEE